MSKIAYRPEVDGLRAIAVLSIVLFHFRIDGAGGGFVGVDIFYVISGFLITKIIKTDLAQGNFGFLHFYKRRARRILPACFAVTLVVALFGWFKLLPAQLDVLGKSILATVFFASNFFFWGQTDYFGTEAHRLHLLHTWSLGVEEQFYLLFPLFLWAVWRVAKDRMLFVVAALALASFAACIIWIREDQPASFYLLPTRAWELLIGALIALRPVSLGEKKGLATVLAAAGLALIAAPIVLYDHKTLFPGMAALPPTVGSAFVIMAGGNMARMVKSALANPFMAGIGKISYSMYLWHWPMAVIFFEHFQGHKSKAPLLFIPLFVISYLSYRFIEQPFRHPSQRLTVRSKALIGLAASSVLVAFGVVSVATRGMGFRLPAEAAFIADFPLQKHDYGGKCFSKMPWAEFPTANCLAAQPGHRSVLIWGDSTAAHYIAGLKAAAHGTDIDVLVAATPGCPPVLGLEPPDRPYCKGRNERVYEYISQSRPSLIILAANWRSHHKTFRPFLEHTTQILVERGLRVTVFGPPIRYKGPLPDLIVNNMLAGQAFSAHEYLDKMTMDIDKNFKDGKIDLHGAQLISILDLVCPRLDCPVRTEGGAPLQWDTHHLTTEGSVFLGRAIFPVLEAMLGRPDDKVRAVKLTGPPHIGAPEMEHKPQEWP